MTITFRILGAVLFLAGVGALAATQAEKPPVEGPVQLAPGVWIRQSYDIGRYGSNVGWIEFAEYVVVVDTAFPLGAEEALRQIKATTKNKPIRYAIVTHYHGDHSSGTGAFAKENATIIAHENARKDYLERALPDYRKTAQKDPLYAKYDAVAPSLTFSDQLVLDDGARRVEIRYFGHAHTTGCVWIWLPKEKVLFTGDACVNGPFNDMGDSDSASWIAVLEKAKGLGAEKIGPAHGAASDGKLLETQQRYFQELRAKVGELVAQGKSEAEVKAAVDVPMWREWTGQPKMNAENVQHVYKELKSSK